MTPLHHFGDWIRALLLGVPLPAARALFLALPAILLAWVLLRRPDPDESSRRARWVKVWAAAALAIQALIYLLA